MQHPVGFEWAAAAAPAPPGGGRKPARDDNAEPGGFLTALDKETAKADKDAAAPRAPVPEKPAPGMMPRSAALLAAQELVQTDAAPPQAEAPILPELLPEPTELPAAELDAEGPAPEAAAAPDPAIPAFPVPRPPQDAPPTGAVILPGLAPENPVAAADVPSDAAESQPAEARIAPAPHVARDRAPVPQAQAAPAAPPTAKQMHATPPAAPQAAETADPAPQIAATNEPVAPEADSPAETPRRMDPSRADVAATRAPSATASQPRAEPASGAADRAPPQAQPQAPQPATPAPAQAAAAPLAAEAPAPESRPAETAPLQPHLREMVAKSDPTRRDQPAPATAVTGERGEAPVDTAEDSRPRTPEIASTAERTRDLSDTPRPKPAEVKPLAETVRVAAPEAGPGDMAPVSETASDRSPSDAPRLTSPNTPPLIDAPRTAMKAIAEALHRAADGSVELTLSPEELGRVRLNLNPGENGISVTITAERGETMDLMRRHADLLNAAMRELGYGDVRLDFAGKGTGDGQARQGGDSAPNGTSDETLTDTRDPEKPLRLAAGGGLDLRL